MELAPSFPPPDRDAGGIAVALFDSVAAVAADADRALDRSRQASLYDRLEWLRLTAAHAPAAGRLTIARARQGKASAWLFLADQGRGIGCGYASWYTLSFAPVFANAHGQATRVALLAAIARALRGRLAQLSLAPLSEATRALLAEGFTAAGWQATATVSSQNWTADGGAGDFAAYWARRPSRLRNTVRRKGKGAPFAIALYDSFDAGAWADYEAVYAASWKPPEGSPAFLRAMAEGESAAGTLRMGIARRGTRPVAAQLWTVEQGIATIHKLAYVEDERAASPGTVLSEAMFRHVIMQDAPRLIDFGTGDDAYKADWMDAKAPLYRLDLYDLRRPHGLWRLARARIGAMSRRAR